MFAKLLIRDIKMGFMHLLLLLQFHFIATHSFSSMQTLCHDDESSALLQFKESFIIDNASDDASDDASAYPKVASWKLQGESVDCCSWDGINCDEATGHVIGLDLSSSWLSGSINSSSTLFQLIHLQSLNLADNDFNFSKIPSGFSHLSRLTYLNLSFSVFSGQIPSDISELFSLSTLDLSRNHDLVLRKPNLRSFVQNLTNLERLDLSSVSTLSTVPDILENLSSLTSLSLKGCGLQGEFPVGIFMLPKLQQLDVRWNENLTGYLPDFPRRSPLKSLILEDTKFSGKLPVSIKNLDSLNVLKFRCCNFSMSIPSSLGSLSQLIVLDLSFNSFSGTIPSSLANLTQLSVLDLSFNSFSGTIPSSLANLTQLTYLSLSSNDLEGENLSWVGKLTKLVYLDLSNINLSGQIILASIANLTQLSRLYLFASSITGKIPSNFSNLTQLSRLYLSDNNFRGTFPTLIYELKNLQNLGFSSNNLSGIVELDRFRNLKNFTTLDLSLNNITLLSKISTNSTPQKFEGLGLSSCNIREFPDFLQNQSELLSELDLSRNFIHGQIPNWMWNTSSLFYLDLSHNLLTGFIQHPSILPMSTRGILSYLNLSYNSIPGQIPNWMWNTSKETWFLDLSHNLLTGFERPPPILPLPYLHLLNLNNNLIQGSLLLPPSSILIYLFSNNSLSGKISPLFCNLSSLHVLDLSRNNLSGTLPPCLGNFSNSLQILNLQGNNFHGMIPPTYRAGNQIRMIDLSKNQFQSQIPRSLANCAMLEVLVLGDNQINDVFPSWLGSLPQLKILILRSNRFYGTMGSPRTNFEFPKLHILDLSGNNLTGKLPSDYFKIWDAMKISNEHKLTYLQVHINDGNFGDYTYTMTITNKGTLREYSKIVDFFIAIDLSSNRFEGEIPESIGDLTVLRMLNLSNNILIGHIPLSLQNIAKLESLDLSKNKLTGEIPQQLTHLTSLAVFEVAYNNLKGIIPRGKQFDTFENKSYEGNSGLCGYPLSKTCGNSRSSSSTFNEDQDSESLFEFDWKIVLMGYGSGFVTGVLIGHIFVTRKWILKTFRRRQQIRRLLKWGHRN